jgi:hypothetical protein
MDVRARSALSFFAEGDAHAATLEFDYSLFGETVDEAVLAATVRLVGQFHVHAGAVAPAFRRKNDPRVTGAADPDRAGEAVPSRLVILTWGDERWRGPVID